MKHSITAAIFLTLANSNSLAQSTNSKFSTHIDDFYFEGHPNKIDCRRFVGFRFPDHEKLPEIARFLQATNRKNVYFRTYDCLVSPNDKYVATMQDDGNFVLYRWIREHPNNYTWIYQSGTAKSHFAEGLVRRDGLFAIYRVGSIHRSDDAEIDGNPNGIIWEAGSPSNVNEHYFLALDNTGYLSFWKGDATRGIVTKKLANLMPRYAVTPLSKECFSLIEVDGSALSTRVFEGHEGIFEVYGRAFSWMNDWNETHTQKAKRIFLHSKNIPCPVKQ